MVMPIPQAKPRAPGYDTPDCATPLVGEGHNREKLSLCTLSPVSHRALKVATEIGPRNESELMGSDRASVYLGSVCKEMCVNVCVCLWGQGQLQASSSGAFHLVFEAGILSDLKLTVG